MNNNGKRLMAAFIAFAMIVCAIAAVAIPSDAGAAGQDGKPTYDFTGDSVVAVDSVEDLTEEIGFTDGVLTVTEDLVLNVTGTIGSTTAPAIKQIVLNGGDLQITGNGTIYIKNTGDGVSTIVFGADDSVLNITGGVTVNLDADGTGSFVINNGDINVNGCTSFNTALLSVTDEAVLNITHTSGKSTWYNADNKKGQETYLDVNNATVNFSESHSVQGVVLDADNAEINFTDADVTAVVLKNGSTITASTLTVDSPTNAGIYMKGTVTIEQGSKVSVSGVKEGKTGINVENVDGQKSELKIDATSSVDAESVGFANSSSDEFTISGSGTFTGDLTKGSATAASYTVQGPITLGNSESPVTATGVSLSTLADNEGNTPTMYLDKNSATSVKYTDGDIVVVNGTKYTMFNKVFTQNFTQYYFTLGVCLGTPTYTGQSFSLSDLSPNADVFGVYEDDKHTEASDIDLSAAVDPSQTEANETLDNIINVGEYPLKVTVTITSGSAGQYYPVNANFEIVAADYNVVLDCGDGWKEDAYTDADAPVVTITDVNNKLVDLDYALTFVDSTGKRYTEAQIASLKAGTYDVIVTAIATDDNYNDVNKTFEDALTVGAFETLDSDVQFFPIESEEILGFDPALIQDGIEFSVPVKTSDGYDVTLTGKVIAIAADDTELLDALNDAGFTSPAAGYYLAFYVDVPEGKHVDTENMTIVIKETDKTDYVQLANPDEESNDVYPYFIYYIGTKLPASTTAVGEDEDDILNVTVDLDGGSADYYKATVYNIDLTQLNLYRIILEDKYNDTLEYLYPEGYEFYLPSGAGQGFNYWTTEDNSPFSSFQTNSIMVVSEKYANGDFEIVLTADYEGSVITPGDPAQSVIIGIYKDVDNGRFVITFVGEDGSVPAGAVNVTINYLVYDDFAQAYVQSSTPITITGEEISADQSIFQITTELGDIDMGLINSIEVSYTAGDVNASNDAIYTVTLPATA